MFQQMATLQIGPYEEFITHLYWLIITMIIVLVA